MARTNSACDIPCPLGSIQFFIRHLLQSQLSLGALENPGTCCYHYSISRPLLLSPAFKRTLLYPQHEEHATFTVSAFHILMIYSLSLFSKQWRELDLSPTHSAKPEKGLAFLLFLVALAGRKVWRIPNYSITKAWNVFKFVAVDKQ